jgi:hypothetical protein
MGFIGCSMSENVAQGYVAVGGKCSKQFPAVFSSYPSDFPEPKSLV